MTQQTDKLGELFDKIFTKNIVPVLDRDTYQTVKFELLAESFVKLREDFVSLCQSPELKSIIVGECKCSKKTIVITFGEIALFCPICGGTLDETNIKRITQPK